MAMIPKFFKDSVVAIGKQTTNVNGLINNYWIGTGFLVGEFESIDEKNNKKYKIYLVTNRHVFENQESVIIRFNSNGENTVKDYKIDLVDNEGNKLYSSCLKNEGDVAVMLINPQTLINDSSVCAFFSLDVHALTISQMEEHQITEGDFIYTLGFPLNLVGKFKKTPICRLGCISSIADMLEHKVEKENFMIDAQTFPGNSGGPVIIRPESMCIEGTKAENQAFLIGILHSYIPYIDNCISMQTGKVRQSYEENTGLTLVNPVDTIIKTINIEKERLNKTK
jgi:hypothetical protein